MSRSFDAYDVFACENKRRFHENWAPHLKRKMIFSENIGKDGNFDPREGIMGMSNKNNLKREEQQGPVETILALL